MTAHGGVITSGNPTVLINGQPAATMGDLHVCPMCSPGPHVGGPVMAGAPTVLIGGKPAARSGDMCTCSAPAPDAIVQGSPNVLIGGASAAASPGAAAAAASAHGATASPGTPGLGVTARPLSPWVGVGYQDKAGRPVAGWRYHAEAGSDVRDGQLGSGGQVWADALAESGGVTVGLVGVTGCRWSKSEARVGDEVKLSARCVGIADGELALFEVWRETASADGAASRDKVWEVMGEVKGGRVEAAAPFAYAALAPSADAADAEAPPPTVADDVPPPQRSRRPEHGAGVGHAALLERPPTYAFSCTVEYVHTAESGLLRYQDWVEFRLLDKDRAPLARADYEVQLATGEIRRGTSDGSAVVRLESVPPGPLRVTTVQRRPRR